MTGESKSMSVEYVTVDGIKYSRDDLKVGIGIAVVNVNSERYKSPIINFF